MPVTNIFPKTRKIIISIKLANSVTTCSHIGKYVWMEGDVENLDRIIIQTSKSGRLPLFNQLRLAFWFFRWKLLPIVSSNIRENLRQFKVEPYSQSTTP